MLLSQYYPPDFDPALLPRGKRGNKDDQMKVCAHVGAAARPDRPSSSWQTNACSYLSFCREACYSALRLMHGLHEANIPMQCVECKLHAVMSDTCPYGEI